MLRPRVLAIELTNRCNADCTYCGRKYLEKIFPDMSLELYKKIIRFPSIREVVFAFWGEPLLYPHIIEAVSYAKELSKKVVLYTNASLLNEEISNMLLKAKTDEIRFSVDGWNKETYEKIRVGLSWDEVFSNIDRFRILKMEGGYQTKTMARVCITKGNENQTNNIRAFWRKMVDEISLVPEVPVVIPPKSEKEKWVSIGKPIKCMRPFQIISVRSNGDVVLCCMDNVGYVMGNLNESSVLEAYNSTSYNKIRKSLREGRNFPSICKACKG